MGLSRRLETAGLVLSLAGLICGCGWMRPPAEPLPASSERPSAPGSMRFRDVAAEAGLKFTWGHQGRTPLTILDSLGQGAAFLDYDSDGLLDIMLVSDARAALFRNRGSGRFEDTTAQMRAGVSGYWHGIASGDLDNDGDPDVCLVGYRSLALLRNDRDRFTDVTRQSGLSAVAWASSAGIADLDADGRLDLVIAEYLEFGPESVQHCTVETVKTACGPKIYGARRPHIYRNRGGRFQEVTREWGFGEAAGKALGIVFGDFNRDRRLDLAFANDEMPQDLFIRQPGVSVRFKNEGPERGFSYLGTGRVQSGMGIDAADYDGDGSEDLVITNFQNEPAGLYANEGVHFTEVSTRAGISEPTFPYVGWGVRFFDADNDADLDLMMANGHIQDNVHLTSASTAYPQPVLLLANDGRGRFRNEGASAGAAFSRPIVGRGLALGDYDNDGKLDALIVDIEGKPLLLHNESSGDRHWLGLDLVTGNPARPALGALATIRWPEHELSRRSTTSGSIFSSHDSRVHFGLGPVHQVSEVTISWPNGKDERFTLSQVDRYMRLVQGMGEPAE